MGAGGWLPPGVTDKDIDDSAPPPNMVRCAKCGREVPLDEAFEMGRGMRRYLVCDNCWAWESEGPGYEPDDAA